MSEHIDIKRLGAPGHGDMVRVADLDAGIGYPVLVRRGDEHRLLVALVERLNEVEPVLTAAIAVENRLYELTGRQAVKERLRLLQAMRATPIGAAAATASGLAPEQLAEIFGLHSPNTAASVVPGSADGPTPPHPFPPVSDAPA